MTVRDCRTTRACFEPSRENLDESSNGRTTGHKPSHIGGIASPPICEGLGAEEVTAPLGAPWIRCPYKIGIISC